MSNNIYDILKKMARLEQPKAKKLTEGVIDPDYTGTDNNAYDEFDRLSSKSALSPADMARRDQLARTMGVRKPADMAKVPGMRARDEEKYKTRAGDLEAAQKARNLDAEAELDRDLERMRKFGGTPGMNESKKKAKPDYLDMDKDGDKKEPMKKAVKDKEKGAIAEAVAIVESALMEKYMGFKKTVAAIKKGGSAENPEAAAAAIGRKKCGKEKFQKAAASGKKLGEDQVEENFSKDEVDAAMTDFMKKGGRAQQLPMKKPRKSEKTDFGSKHIAGRGEAGTGKAARLGKQAKSDPKGKPVVTAEDDMGEGNEFSGALARARAQGKDNFSVDGKTYSVKEGWEDMQAYLNKKNKDSQSKGGAGKKAGKRYGGSAQKDDDSDTETKAADTPKTRGRPKKDKFSR